jgi:hypothetical protein
MYTERRGLLPRKTLRRVQALLLRGENVKLGTTTEWDLDAYSATLEVTRWNAQARSEPYSRITAEPCTRLPFLSLNLSCVQDAYMGLTFWRRNYFFNFSTLCI